MRVNEQVPQRGGAASEQILARAFPLPISEPCAHLRKRHSVFEFSLYLSRACLGKISHLCINGSKILFSRTQGIVPAADKENTPVSFRFFQLSLLFVCPEPVLT